MTDRTAAALREDYLARLDAALREVPHGLAMEIRDGVAEELQGDDAERVQERLVFLGEPDDIAREARIDAVALPAAAPSVIPDPVPVVQRTSFAVVAALLFGFGTFIVPVVGWAAGAALVIMSGRWSRGEKAWALVAPFAISALLGLTSLLVRAASGRGLGGAMLPAQFDIVWSGLLLAFVVAIPVASLWLLLRLRGRAESRA